jgi:hypothetical protein
MNYRYRYKQIDFLMVANYADNLSQEQSRVL